MLTWKETEHNLRNAGLSDQAIANSRQAHAQRFRINAMKAKQQSLIEEYQNYRRTHLLDYFEELADRQARLYGV